MLFCHWRAPCTYQVCAPSTRIAKETVQVSYKADDADKLMLLEGIPVVVTKQFYRLHHWSNFTKSSKYCISIIN